MRRKSSRIIAIVLVMAMVIATLNMNTSVRAEEAIEKEIATSSDAESESIKSDEGTDSTESDEVDVVNESEEENNTIEIDQEDLVAFSQSQSVDGVRVTVTASEGAFPEGATLSVNKATDSEKEQINQAVEAVRDDSVSVAEAYTFDIKVLDENGTELQPANGQTVNVSFAMDEVSNQNLSTDIYHIPEGNGSLVAEELSTSESGNTVTAVSDGFSYYTVEFTYDEKQYVMEGDTSVALTDILSYVGITKADGSVATNSDITSVSVSDESLFSASNESGEWIVTAHQAFHTDEWMKVTVDGVEYEIVVTDASHTRIYEPNATHRIRIKINSVTFTPGDINKDVSSWSVRSFSVAKDFNTLNTYHDSYSGNPVGQEFVLDVSGSVSQVYFWIEPNNDANELGGFASLSGTTATFKKEQNVYPLYLYYHSATVSYTVLENGPISVAPTVTPPTLASSLTYNGSGQQLITDAGSTSGNNMQYGISSSSTTQPTAWYSSITDSNLKRTECGTYYVWYKAAATGNYTEVVPTYKGSVTITQKEVGLSWSNTSFVYDGSVRVPTATATGLNSGDTCTVTVTGGQKNAGNYTATASGLSNSNYKLPSDKTCNYSINKANLTVTAKPKTIIYGDAPANDGVTYRGFKGSDSASSLGGSLSYTYSYSRYGNVGNTYTITPGGLTSSNYNITFAAGTLTVNQKEVGLIWSDTSLTYNGSPQKPTATATGLVNGDEIGVSVTGEQTNAGENYTATASALTGTKAGNYKLPASNTQSFSINGASMSDEVSSTGYTGTYDATAHNITVNVPEGATVKYRTTSSGDYDLTENPAFTDAGTYTVYYQVTKPNYATFEWSEAVVISPIELTLNWSTDNSFIYNGSPQVPTATISGVINGDDCTVSVNGAKTDYSASPYTATAVLDGAKKGNYKLPAENTKPFTISKKTATIKGKGQAVTYGTSIASGVDNAIASDLVDGDTLTSITLTPSTSDVTTDGTITPSAAVIMNGDTDVTKNYNITYNTGSLTINKKPITISGITASNKTYDGTTAATLNYSGINWADCGKVGDDDLSVTATGAFSDAYVDTGKNVTITGLTLGGTKAGNYELAESGQQTSTTADITTKALTIKADSDSKVYDGTAHTKNSYSVTSGVLADGDTIESVTVTGSQKYAGSSDNVPSAAVIRNSSGVDVTSNYNITYMKGTIEVTKKPLTITADSDTKVYDATALTNNGYTSTGLAEGDTFESVTVTGSQTVVGSSDNTVGTVVIKKGNQDVTENYDITFTNGTLTVTKKALTITATDATKTYDSTALTSDAYEATELGEGDEITSVTFTGGQTDFGSSKNKPSDAVIMKGSVNVTDCYDITYVEGTLEVTKAIITVDGITAEDKQYDATTDATLDFSGAVLDGKCGDDDVSVTAKGTFCDKNVGEDKTVNISDLELIGAKKDNYELAATGNQETTTASITDKVEVIQNPDGTTTTITTTTDEDGNEVVTEKTEKDGEVIEEKETHYDEDGNVTKETETTHNDDGTTTEKETVYNDDGTTTETVTEKDKDGNVTKETVTEKDKDGNVTKETETEIERDEDGNVTKETITEKDGDGNVTKETEITHNDDGTTTEKETVYNDDGTTTETVTEKDKDGNTTKETVTEKDKDGNVTKETETTHNDDGTTTEKENVYNDDGTTTETVTEKDKDGNVTKETVTEKDKDGNVTKETETTHNDDGTTTEKENVYNDDGTTTETVTEKDKDGNVTKETVTEKDKDGRITKETETQYDENGNVTQVTETTTSADGKTRTTVVRDGEGNIIDTYEEEVSPDSNAAKFVKKLGEAPDTTMDNSVNDLADMLLNDDEKVEMEAGERVSMYLTIEDISETVDSQDKAKIAAVVAGAGLTEYYDINLYKKIGTADEQKITETSSPINMTLQISDDLINTDPNIERSYVLVRLHEGTAAVVPANINLASKTASFGSDRFSIYAIVCIDKTTGSKTDAKADTAKKTGDDTNLQFMFFMMINSAIAIGVLYYKRRRRKGFR